ncbi:phosphotransferase [Saccharospirillum mangrovi]|uniref:phosphotransferase n=1 Tax=Saccharospirillum mangrovi TaxID=2161747 RepID=UPI0013009584|nr:phosphotransferase [Saccharospirillum mangrovi]
MQLALFQVLDELGERLPDALSVARWPGGLCNRLYKIDTADGVFALRINHPDADRLGVNRDREQRLLISLADQPWCPTTLSVNERWLLTPWLPGNAPAAGEHADLAWLATALTAVQAVEVPGPALNIAEQIRHLLAYCDDLNPAFVSAVEQRCSTYQLPTRLTLTHHDWHPGNVKIDGKNWVLLDWEFAALGDPAMDLAAVCSGFALSAEQGGKLADVMDIEADRLHQAQAMMSALATVWYAANPDLAPPNAPSQVEWLGKWN